MINDVLQKVNFTTFLPGAIGSFLLAHSLLKMAESRKPTADLVSYGHDIEAVWLLLEAAEILSDAPWVY